MMFSLMLYGSLALFGRHNNRIAILPT